MTRCPNCQAWLDEDIMYCGNCGQQVAPLQARGATASYPQEGENTGAHFATRTISQRTAPMTPPTKNTPPPQGPPPTGRRRGRGLLISAALLLALLAGTLVFILTNQRSASGGSAANASGQVTFFDSPNGTGSTDALKIVVSGLSIPGAGSDYEAWLVDETGEHTTPLGALTARGTVFSLAFAGNGHDGLAGINLLGSGNVVEITQEQGRAQLPAGKVLLSATFAPRAFIHIKHLLFSFPVTPAKIGLLVGLLGQTRLLNAQALALESLAGNRNPAAVACLAQSIIDISEGQQGGHFQLPPASCGSSLPTGDGFGILGSNGYATTAATHASLAATQSDSTATIRLHASEVETGTTSITGLMTGIDRDAQHLLANPADATSIQEIATLANHALQGVDSNGDGQIDPVASEEGAATTYLRGQLLANLTLSPHPQAVGGLPGRSLDNVLALREYQVEPALLTKTAILVFPTRRQSAAAGD
jgi:hypothetical protein